MLASIAARRAGRADITADMPGVDIDAGTAGIGAASTSAPISTAFRTAIIILIGRVAIMACLGAQNGIAGACETGDMATATTEVVCVIMVAAHVE